MVSRVSFQGLYGRVSLQGLHGGRNISGVQISRDSTHALKANGMVVRGETVRRASASCKVCNGWRKDRVLSHGEPPRVAPLA